MSTDRIEKNIMLRAPRSRVWRALTTPRELGAWFRVDLSGVERFAPGTRAIGQVMYPGYEHLRWDVTIERMEPEQAFSWRWHPYPSEPEHDYSSEEATLVEFALEEVDGGTMLRVVESGFDRLPVARRAEAYRMNEGGWATQMTNIERHLREAA